MKIRQYGSYLHARYNTPFHENIDINMPVYQFIGYLENPLNPLDPLAPRPTTHDPRL